MEDMVTLFVDNFMQTSYSEANSRCFGDMDMIRICSSLHEKETGNSCYAIIDFGEDGKDAELKQDTMFKVEEYMAKKKRLWTQFETHTHRHITKSRGQR